MDKLGNINLHNKDCMLDMVDFKDNHFDLAIVDPPYGIGFDKKRYAEHETSKKKGFMPIINKEKPKSWDKSRPNISYFNEIQRVSKNQIIWGGNYFADLLPASMGWIYWHKKGTDKTKFSDGELAWTSFKVALKCFKYDWIGFGYINNAGKDKKIHPTQKPVALYKWLLQNYAKQGNTILDTHLGSGSIAIACHDLSFKLTGYELDKDYYNAAIERIRLHQDQLQFNF